MPKKGLTKLLTIVICVILLFQLMSCGTLLHPERRDQKLHNPKLDLQVVILDGLLLLFWVFPAAIAFGVDFVTGAIYLPGGKTSSLNEVNTEHAKEQQVIHIDPEQLSMEMIEDVIQQQTGQAIRLTSSNVLYFKPNTEQVDIQQELVNIQQHGIESSSHGVWFTGDQAHFISDEMTERLVKIEVRSPMTPTGEMP